MTTAAAAMAAGTTQSGRSARCAPAGGEAGGAADDGAGPEEAVRMAAMATVAINSELSAGIPRVGPLDPVRFG
jgi:hypothetical protein